MKTVEINHKQYEIIEEYKNGFDKDVVLEKLTDYFESYDYIVGDWSYGKLRLKGFCEKCNPNYKPYNDIKEKERYIKTQCAYECRYFVLKKNDKIVYDL